MDINKKIKEYDDKVSKIKGLEMGLSSNLTKLWDESITTDFEKTINFGNKYLKGIKITLNEKDYYIRDFQKYEDDIEFNITEEYINYYGTYTNESILSVKSNINKGNQAEVTIYKDETLDDLIFAYDISKRIIDYVYKYIEEDIDKLIKNKVDKIKEIKDLDKTKEKKVFLLTIRTDDGILEYEKDENYINEFLLNMEDDSLFIRIPDKEEIHIYNKKEIKEVRASYRK